MDSINQFSSDITDIREALKGFWGTEITKNVKISYLGTLILAQGNLEEIKKICNKPVYDWNNIGTNIYIAWIKN